MDKAFEGFTSLLTTIGPAGYPTSLLGGVLMLFFYLRKQEAGVRNDIVLSLQRLQKDKELLQAAIDKLTKEKEELQKEVDEGRKERRALEDKLYNESKRADGLQDRVRELKRENESD